MRAGLPYLGWSAGANLACPTIRTTNDMPVVDPDGFGALGLVPFQINPHYSNALPPGHMGETRDQRLAELLVVDPTVVVAGLREGSALRVEGARVTLLGPHPLRLFRAGQAPVEVDPGDVTRVLTGETPGTARASEGRDGPCARRTLPFMPQRTRITPWKRPAPCH